MSLFERALEIHNAVAALGRSIETLDASKAATIEGDDWAKILDRLDTAYGELGVVRGRLTTLRPPID